LKYVLGSFPTGTLTAIIGGSRSGKVYIHPHMLHSTDPISYFTCCSHRQPSPMFFLVVCGDQASLSPEAHVTMNLPTFSVTSAYIAQTDAPLPTPTVRETLPYVTPLRLPSSTTSLRNPNIQGGGGSRVSKLLVAWNELICGPLCVRQGRTTLEKSQAPDERAKRMRQSVPFCDRSRCLLHKGCSRQFGIFLV